MLLGSAAWRVKLHVPPFGTAQLAEEEPLQAVAAWGLAGQSAAPAASPPPEQAAAGQQQQKLACGAQAGSAVQWLPVRRQPAVQHMDKLSSLLSRDGLLGFTLQDSLRYL